MVTKRRTQTFYGRRVFYLIVVLALLTSSNAGAVVGSENVQHYKMISTVEYAGKGQFRNHVETLLTVNRQLLSDDKVRYLVSAKDFNLAGGGQQSSFDGLSFVIDRRTKRLSGLSEDLSLLARVNNQCVKSLKRITKKNVGKTWKQSFNLSLLDTVLPERVNLTLTAIRLQTKVFGEMVAVRALSEPFSIDAAKESGAIGTVRCRINAVYLFDAQFEDIYISIATFEASTSMNGFKERLRHEVATYLTDADGISADLSGVSKEFEKLVKKIGLTKKGLEVKKKLSLPRWAQSEVLMAAQASSICAATACEGAANPVIAVCLPAARIMITI